MMHVKMITINIKHIKGIIVGWLLNKVNNWIINYKQKVIRNDEKALLNKYSDKKLSISEHEEIVKIWGKLGLKINTSFFDLYKSKGVYNPLFMPNDIYFSIVLDSLNPPLYRRTYEDKGLYPVLFDKIHQPKILGRCINGTLFDENNDVTSYSSFLKPKINQEVIIKPNCQKCGKGIRLANLEEIDVNQLMKEYNNNFIIQEYVKQSSYTSKFNPTSFNNFRVTSLFLNSKLSICAVELKCGGKGSIVDNMHAGGLTICCSEDGHLDTVGYNVMLEEVYECDNGYKIVGEYIPGVTKIVNMVKKYHPYYFPNIGLIGWDIGLDENDEPILVEVNITYPGIISTQVCTRRPIFGERTEEVIEYVRTHRSKQTLPENPWII